MLTVFTDSLNKAPLIHCMNKTAKFNKHCGSTVAVMRSLCQCAQCKKLDIRYGIFLVIFENTPKYTPEYYIEI